MNKPYILSPAGSFDALVSAVNAGADEVYFGFGEFNARQNAQNFTDDDLKKAINLCRIVGVKSNITVNTLVTDKEMPRVLDLVYNAASLGADAFIVQDMGLAAAIKGEMPSVCLHASTQCACHNSEGAQRLAAMGFSRVVLAREMPKEEIEKVVKLGIETEIFVHGALCVCHSGMCLMSSVIGKRSGNRGLCAQPCRLAYTLDGQRNKSYPLSLKDACLGTKIEDIIGLGVTSLKIEGRMKSPDYVYGTTKIWREIVDGGKNADSSQIKSLENIFSRGGFTHKYFTGEYVKNNKDMYGIRSQEDKNNTRIAQKQGDDMETRKRDISLFCTLEEGKNAVITASCGDVTVTETSDFVCETAKDRPVDVSSVKESLSKLGGTYFRCDEPNVKIKGSIFLAKSMLNALRRSVVSALEEKLTKTTEVQRARTVLPKNEGTQRFNGKMDIFASCNSVDTALKAQNVKYVSIPAEEFLREDIDEKLLKLREKKTVFGVRFPRVVFDSEQDKLCELAKKAKGCGAVFAEISNIGHFDAARKAELSLFAATGMNVFNSMTVQVLKKEGFGLVTLSPELNEAQIRDIARPIGIEICAFVRGRLPLMVLESCIFKASDGCRNDNVHGCGELCDRIGKCFRVYGEKRLCENTHYKPCRNIIVNAVEADILSSREKLDKMNVNTGLVYMWE